MLTLASRVAPDAPKLARKELFALVIALARYVAELHEEGQTADDLRPAALEIEPRGTDFVVRRAADVEPPTAESPEAVIARSPEQLRDASFVSKTADVYGVGVLVYRLAAGRAPFGGESFHEMLLAIADAEAPPLEMLRPDLGAPLGVAVRRAMAVDPVLRFPDAQELLGALEEAREAGPITMPTATGGDADDPQIVAPTDEPAGGETSVEDDLAESASGRWLLQLTFGFLLVLGVVALGYRYLAPRGKALPTTSAATLEAARAAASEYREKTAPGPTPAPSATP